MYIHFSIFMVKTNHFLAQQLFALGVVAELSKGADSSSFATYGVILISLGHIPAQVSILGISCHFFISTLHFM